MAGRLWPLVVRSGSRAAVVGYRTAGSSAAVAAYDRFNSNEPLPRNTTRLLAAMFASNDVCQRNLDDIAADGFGRDRLPALLRRLVEVGLLSRERDSARVPNTYRLHLPPVRP